ncbi:PKD domain-containing protein, partial [Actinophytocola sp.]|uniref:PKD domain-containing protein n=1 Tax=Actinophytocola sp. TaxID=1872138 RepID=UPI002ED961E0
MSASSASAPKRVLSLFVASLLTTGAVALALPGTAQADSQPLAGTPATVAADALPTVQINGVAWAQAVVGNTVYVGGDFTTARPAGAAAGTQETPRNNLLAYDIRTGELITSFAPVLNGQVLAVTASPDGSRIYVAGDFTQADGQVRNRVAAYDTATGALVSNWRPNINSQVRALAVTADTVYMGGSITAVGGVSRTRLAAVSTADGTLLPWAPLPGVGSTSGSDQVMSLVVTGNGTQVVAAGRFASMNGTKATGVAAIDAVTGATRPFAINQKITNQGSDSAVYSVTTDGVNVYGTAYDFGGPGNLEGSFVAKADGGAIVEINDCRGDTYSSYPSNGVLYVASHTHNCSPIGGFPEQNPRVHKFATAYTIAPSGVGGATTFSNKNLVGQPAGKQLDWFPTMTPGTYTGQGQAGWSVTGNGQYVVYGGEFPRVNGAGQQGLVRYAVPALAPNKVGPADGLTATATSPAAGVATIGWTTTDDQDNQYLTYSVYREGEAAPVYETVKGSLWWQNTAMSATEAGVSGSLRYRVVATDPFGNRTTGDWVAVDVAPAPVTGTIDYASAVKADGAQSHWRLGDTTGTTAADAIGNRPMTVGSGVSRAVAGALSADTNTAFSFNGSAQATLATQTSSAAPNTFTAEAWFQTSSGSGGRILGFASAASGSSSTYDRQVYLDSRGRVNFGVDTLTGKNRLTERTVGSSASFNDGKWHHVAASMSSSGMALYVDGKLVDSRTDTTTGASYNGYFRVGSDRAMSGSSTFTGRIDEVALYPAALSAVRVAAHATAGGASQAPNLPPTARFASSSTGLAATVDATGTKDVDGTIPTYAWTFGDGSTGTGATATRTYAAAGTYLVTLTVTDNRGATSTATRMVSVAPVVPNKAPTAAFTATAKDLVLSVDAAGSADSDGVVKAYAWNFGDGATATGATASHIFATGGSHHVTLTVTDDKGATGATGRDVTVVAPPVEVVVANDAFGRTVTGGLGTADVGGAWTAPAGAARQSVSAGVAELRLDAANQNTGSYLGGLSLTDATVLTSFSLDAMPTGGGTMVFVSGRRVASNQEYRVRVRFAPDGQVGLSVSRLSGGTEGFPGG